MHSTGPQCKIGLYLLIQIQNKDLFSIFASALGRLIIRQPMGLTEFETHI